MGSERVSGFVLSCRVVGVGIVAGFWLTLWAMRGMYFVLACLLRSETSMPTALARSMRRLGYSVALFASLSAHLWWDRLLGPC